MIVTQKIGNLTFFETGNRSVDLVILKWHEARKRILRKVTQSGKEISIRFLNENPELTEGDILFADETTLIAVAVEPCECIVVTPKNMFEMASACYEIGNKHLPLFYEKDELLVPFEMPLFNLLQVYGYNVKNQTRQLLHPLKTTVAPHNISISPQAVFI